jgi:hypothetical protein
MKKLFLVLGVLSCLIINSQDLEKESYFPLKEGNSKTLTWYKSKYREVIKDTTTINGEIYTEISQIFPPKKEINIYLRKSNDTIYFFNKKDKKEIIFFGIGENKGEKIGKGTIKKVNAKLKTPKGKLSGLLVVEMNYSNGSSSTRYYKKGLGLVAVKKKKKLICYYVPD